MASEITVSGRGRSAFGPDIAALLDTDPHRAGSVDAVLLDRPVAVTHDNRATTYAPAVGRARFQPGSRPDLEAVLGTALDGAVHEVDKAIRLTRFCARIRPTVVGHETPTSPNLPPALMWCG